MIQVARHRVGPDKKVGIRQRRLFVPGVFVGGEYRKGLVSLSQHLVLFEDGLILEAMERAVIQRQRGGNIAVAQYGRGLAVAIGIDRRNAQLARQRRNRRARSVMAHDQAAACLAQRRIQFDQRSANEFYAAVLPWQGVENVAVEDECHIHLAVAAQRLVQRRMVGQAQIAAQPDEGRAIIGGWGCLRVMGVHLR